MYTIIGSGFGMYGYVPAVINSGNELILQQKYYDFVNSRSDLKNFSDKIIWENNLASCLEKSDSLIVAQNPESQYDFFQDDHNLQNISKIIIEKPFAQNPKKSLEIINEIFDQKKKLRSGFIFLNTGWFQNIEKLIQENKDKQEIEIIWNFQAHHFKNNLDIWKKNHSQGGAVIRFYSIHIIALLTKLNFDKIIKSEACFDKNQDEIFQLDLESVSENHIIKVKINSNSDQNQFKISANNKLIANLDEPFSEFYHQNQKIDHRSQILQKIIQSFDEKNSFYNDFYIKLCQNWQNIENQTKFQKICKQ